MNEMFRSFYPWRRQRYHKHHQQQRSQKQNKAKR